MRLPRPGILPVDVLPGRKPAAVDRLRKQRLRLPGRPSYLQIKAGRWLRGVFDSIFPVSVSRYLFFGLGLVDDCKRSMERPAGCQRLYILPTLLIRVVPIYSFFFFFFILHLLGANRIAFFQHNTPTKNILPSFNVLHAMSGTLVGRLALAASDSFYKPRLAKAGPQRHPAPVPTPGRRPARLAVGRHAYTKATIVYLITP